VLAVAQIEASGHPGGIRSAMIPHPHLTIDALSGKLTTISVPTANLVLLLIGMPRSREFATEH
jgi:hypothetical protein